MFIRAKYELQFSRRDALQNYGFDPAIENRRIVWTSSFNAGGSSSKAEESISYNYRFHIVTRFKS